MMLSSNLVYRKGQVEMVSYTYVGIFYMMYVFILPHQLGLVSCSLMDWTIHYKVRT